MAAPPPAFKYVWADPKDLENSGLKPRSNFNVKKHIDAHETPPLNDQGGVMCLSYHARGNCKTDCERGMSSGDYNDHCCHNASETQRLTAYIAKAVPTSAPGGN